jgi:hypothetical protein
MLASRTSGWDEPHHLHKRVKEEISRWKNNVIEFNGLAIKPVGDFSG